MRAAGGVRAVRAGGHVDAARRELLELHHRVPLTSVGCLKV
ncbi:hypothetical protein ACWEQU_26395 [Streptomyces nodosus]|nr:hypothetical protein [Streptomyces sp. SID2888]